MNAIISLCHFCENHGPGIIFCTQALHSHSPPNAENVNSLQSVESGCSKCEEELESCELESVEDCEKASEGASLYYGTDAEGCGPGGMKPLKDDTEIQSSNTPGVCVAKLEVKCEACRSFPPGLPGYISTDSEARMSYASSQHPSHPQLFAMVRQACVRSLSSEISPGRDGPGPIFYGDDNSGYVLSHSFIIKDSQYSRGFQRKYSFIVVMMDKIFLLNSWPFLVKHIKEIIEELQAKALKVYETEQAKCPVRSQHAHKCGLSPFQTSHVMIAPSKPARSLLDLTGDKHIFRKLHQTFTWLLKAGGNRLTENLLEGPPTEDSIIDVEHQEETEEGFILLDSKKEITGEQIQEGHMPDADELSDDDDEECPQFKNLRHLLKVFGYSRFHRIAYHVTIGNQIIVRGRQRKLAKSIIDCFKTLLPKGCCRVIYYSNQYEDTWRCNFLGLTPGLVLPKHIDLYVVIDVHEIVKGQSYGEEVEEEVEDAVQSLQEGEFSRYTFTVESPMTLPDKGPMVLKKMEYALLNDNLADSVVDQCLICLKEEWMNKVKVLFKFTKAGGSRSDDDTRELLRVVGAQHEDKVVLKFWMTGLSVQYRNHMLSSAINQAVSK